jgi:hypothetical protein
MNFLVESDEEEGPGGQREPMVARAPGAGLFVGLNVRGSWS